MKIYAYVTTDGTSMAEAAYCEHHTDVAEKVREIAMEADDCPMPPVFVDIEENEAVFCYSCGINYYGESADSYENFYG